jgi:hypothetical protein
MRKGQRGRFIGHENYDGDLEGGELFTITYVDEYFPKEKHWLIEVRLDTGETTFLLSDSIEILTEEDDLTTLKILIDKYPEQTKKYLKL